jgi:hypothetical protein
MRDWRFIRRTLVEVVAVRSLPPFAWLAMEISHFE